MGAGRGRGRGGIERQIGGARKQQSERQVGQRVVEQQFVEQEVMVGDRAGLTAMAVRSRGTDSTNGRFRTLSIRPARHPASTETIGPAAIAFSAAGEAHADPTPSLWSDARTSQTILRARSGFFSPRGIPRTRRTDCGDVAVGRPGADRRLSWTSETTVSPTSAHTNLQPCPSWARHHASFSAVVVGRAPSVEGFFAAAAGLVIGASGAISLGGSAASGAGAALAARARARISAVEGLPPGVALAASSPAGFAAAATPLARAAARMSAVEGLPAAAGFAVAAGAAPPAAF